MDDADLIVLGRLMERICASGQKEYVEVYRSAICIDGWWDLTKEEAALLYRGA